MEEGKKIYLLMGPSGSGKTTLGRYLQEIGVVELVSHTTRKPRPGEVDGKTYYFVSEEEFNKTPMIEQTEYAGNLYGNSIKEVEGILSVNDRAFAIVDRNGALSFKSLYKDNCKVIYIYTTKIDMIERMKNRGDRKEEIRNRMLHSLAFGEMENFDIADYVILNKDLDEAKRQLKCIVGR